MALCVSRHKQNTATWVEERSPPLYSDSCISLVGFMTCSEYRMKGFQSTDWLEFRTRLGE
jgi:hypothetical protein